MPLFKECRIRVLILLFTAALCPLLCMEETRAAVPSLQSRYDSLLADREALVKDARRSMLREGWEKIATSLNELAREAPKGALAMNARFEEGRTWHELGKRSHSSKDYVKAVEAFITLERIYRGNNRAAEALLQAAAIQSRDLKNNAAALSTLDALIAGYSKSPSRAQADDLRKALATGESAPTLPSAPQASQTPASKPDPAAAVAIYSDAAEQWRTLLADIKGSTLRDNWLKLEKRFLEALAKNPDGETGAKARFQAGRCMEELAGRSFLRSDWLGAVAHFEALARDFPGSSLADDGLYRAAFIKARRLDDKAAARRSAEAVLSQYPKGDMAANARELLKGLPAVSAANVPGPGGAIPGLPLAAHGPFLRAVRWQSAGKGLNITLELEAGTSFSYQMLGAAGGEPMRLQVDISGVRPGPAIKTDQPVRGGVVSRIRIIHLGKENTRVLFDLAGVTHYKATPMEDPTRISVRASGANDISGGFAVDPKKQADVVRRGEFAAASAPKAPESLVEQLGLTVKAIMIDPGHGGKDPGTTNNGIVEKGVTLKMARILGDLLVKQGFTVIYTRESDTFISLEDRPVLANDSKADLFISLHVNANPDAKVSGVECYFMDLARTSSAAHVAARENAVSVKSISDLQFILADLMLSSKLEESREMAGFVQSAAMNRIHRAGFESRDNGVRSAPFYVLMGARMPAVLVEIGYCTNGDDAKRIKNDKYLLRLAEGIAEGVVGYKEKITKFAK